MASKRIIQSHSHSHSHYHYPIAVFNRHSVVASCSYSFAPINSSSTSNHLSIQVTKPIIHSFSTQAHPLPLPLPSINHHQYRYFATTPSSTTKDKNTNTNTNNNNNDDDDSDSKEDHQGLIHKYVQPSGSNSVDLQIHVLPASRRNELKEVNEKGIVMKLTTRSTDDKDGNNEVIKFLSDVLKLPKENVSVKDGYDSSNKIVNVKLPPNVKRDDIEDRLAQAFTSFPLGL